MDAMPTDDVRDIVKRLQLSGDLSRQETEALLLELRHLARRHGLRMREVTEGEGAEEP